MYCLRIGSLGLLVLALGYAPTDAEVTARQGESPVKEFASPMILEVPLPNAGALAPGASRSLTSDLQMFACDGVTISRLDLGLKRQSKRAGATLVLELAGTVHVPPSVDRHVDLLFVAKAGEAVVGQAERRKLDAEEDRHTKFKTTIVFDDPGDEEALSGSQQPVLEITMAVSDNG